MANSCVKVLAGSSYTVAVVEMDDTTVRQIVGADASRISVTLSVDDDSPGPVYLVDSDRRKATAGRKIKPGALVVINTTGPVYVVDPNGAGTIVYAVCEID